MHALEQPCSRRPEESQGDERTCGRRECPGKGALPSSVETLEQHWDSLPDSRKQMLAQMAVLTRLVSCPEAPSTGSAPVDPCLTSLAGTSLRRKRRQKQCREYMAGAGAPNLPAPREIAHLLARFSCNSHTICDEELRVTGDAPHLLPRMEL